MLVACNCSHGQAAVMDPQIQTLLAQNIICVSQGESHQEGFLLHAVAVGVEVVDGTLSVTPGQNI